MTLGIQNIKRSIVVIDKPSGPTSFDISNFIRKQLDLNKTSHFGTLDPKVTGVLPIALGSAVRLTAYFSRQDKEYVGIMHLHEDIEEKKIKEVIKKRFLGKIKQLPPVKSRVKREEREREIKRFEILEKQEKDILFKVECQAGTYIRKLVHDLGNELGVGAHMTELRRIRASIFLEKDSVTLYDFVKAVEEYKKGNPEKLKKMLLPIEIVKKIMPSLIVKQQFIDKLKHGSPLFKEMIERHDKFNKNEEIAIFYNNSLIEISDAVTESGKLKDLNKKEIIAKALTVFN